MKEDPILTPAEEREIRSLVRTIRTSDVDAQIQAMHRRANSALLVPTPEEEDVFAALGIRYVNLEERRTAADVRPL